MPSSCTVGSVCYIDRVIPPRVALKQQRICSRSSSIRHLSVRRPLTVSAAVPPTLAPNFAQDEISKLLRSQAVFAFQNPFSRTVKPANFTESVGSLQFPNPVDAIQFPTVVDILTFLLANPFVTLVLAVGLYVFIPRLWRAFVRYIFIPASVIGAGVVVIKNPSFFANAGALVASFSSDHPYITSAVILGILAIILSPYVLTAVIALLVVTGVPKLPASVRTFLPAPVLEVEQTLSTFDSYVRGPVDRAKEKIFETGKNLTDGGVTFLSKSVQSSPQISTLQESQIK